MMFQDNNLFAHLTAAQERRAGHPPTRCGSRPRTAPGSRRRSRPSISPASRRDAPRRCRAAKRQRVALARALVSKKPLLLLDEPFGALDPGLRREMIAIVDALRRARGITVLITIHTPEDVVDRADVLAFVADGRVIVQDAPRAALDAARDPRIAAFRRSRGAREHVTRM